MFTFDFWVKLSNFQLMATEWLEVISWPCQLTSRQTQESHSTCDIEGIQALLYVLFIAHSTSHGPAYVYFWFLGEAVQLSINGNWMVGSYQLTLPTDIKADTRKPFYLWYRRDTSSPVSTVYSSLYFPQPCLCLLLIFGWNCPTVN